MMQLEGNATTQLHMRAEQNLMSNSDTYHGEQVYTQHTVQSIVYFILLV